MRSREQLNHNHLTVDFRKKYKKSRPKVWEASLLWSTTMSWLEEMKELQWRHKGNPWSWNRTYERVWNVAMIPSELLVPCLTQKTESIERKAALFEVTKVIKELLCFVGIIEVLPSQKSGSLQQPPPSNLHPLSPACCRSSPILPKYPENISSSFPGYPLISHMQSYTWCKSASKYFQEEYN